MSDLTTIDPVDSQYTTAEEWPLKLDSEDIGTTTKNCLTLDDWATRKVPMPDFLLGSIFSTTTRAMLSAETGIGKTHFGFAIAFAIAAGQGLCHWQGRRKARVLIIDGEMAVDLVKQRLEDEAERAESRPKGLYVLCSEDAPNMPPLDIEEGQEWLDQFIENLGGIDFLILDNVMSLTIGDLKEEEAWKPVIPWMRGLTKRRIGCLWINHTGHDSTRSYGTKTREWQLDTVIIAEKGQDNSADISMRLTFTKARQRRPETRNDFNATVLTLRDGRWSSESAQARTKTNQTDRALELLRQAIDESGIPVPGLPSTVRGVKQATWEAYCDTHDLSEADEKDSRKKAFRRAVRVLRDKKWICSKGKIVRIIK